MIGLEWNDRIKFNHKKKTAQKMNSLFYTLLQVIYADNKDGLRKSYKT